MSRRRDGARCCASTLRELGVSTVFSLSGQQVLPLYDALDREGVGIVHSRHEAGAVYMAESYGQVRGTTGVCLVSAGPGFLAALNAVFSAAASETPLVMLAGSSPVGERETGAFQELDQSRLAKVLCKGALVAEDASDVEESIRQAWRLASDRVPGPVAVILPVDVQEQLAGSSVDEVGHASATAGYAAVAGHATVAAAEGSGDDDFAGLVDLVGRSRAPVAIVRPSLGRGAAQLVLERLGEVLPVFVAESPRGLKDPLYGEMRSQITGADLTVVAGPCDFSLGLHQRSAGPPVVFLIADSDEDVALARRRAARGDLELIGVLRGPALPALDALARRFASTVDRESPRRRAPSEERRAGVHKPEGTGGLHPARIGDLLAEVVAAEDVLVTDGGEFGQWMRGSLGTLPNRRVFNGKAGAIGSAIPHAVGAAVAGVPGMVWACCGDGAFGYGAAELDTAARVGARICVVVGNDSRWSAEWHSQTERYGVDRTVGTDLAWRDLELVAAGYGARGWSAQSEADLRQVLRRVLAAEDGMGPSCVNVRMESVKSPA